MTKRKIRVPLLVLVLLSSAAAAGVPPPSPAPAPVSPAVKPAEKELRGRVAGEDGKPVAHATVRVLAESPERAAGPGRRRTQPEGKPLRAESAEDGSFSFKRVPADSLILRVEAKGFAPFLQRQVPAGASVRVSLKKGTPVSGIVRDLSTKKGIAGAVVLACEPEAIRFGEEACRTATSAEDGRFTLSDLPRGSVDVEARSAGHAATRLAGITLPQVTEGAGAHAPLELFLKPGGRLAGRVLGADGKPVEDASVRLRPVDMNLREMFREAGARPASTDASGKFAFEGLATGRYRLAAEKKGLAPVEAGPYEVQPGTDLTSLELRLEPGATLAVRLVDPDEKPVHGLEVEIVDPKQMGARFLGGQAVEEEQVHEGEDGRYTVTQLRAGTFTLRLLPQDFAEIEKENVKFKTGEATDLGTITVREGRSIAGQVTDGGGAPVAAASVTAFWTGDAGFKTREARTRSSGKYRISGLGEGPVDMLVVHAKGFAHAEREGAAPGDRSVDFVLERTGSILGRVQAPGGKVPAAFRVNVHPEAHASGGMLGGMLRRFLSRDPERGEQVFSDPTGAFRLDDVDPGSYTLEALADHLAPARKTGIVVSGEGVTDAGTLDFEPGIVLRGRALDARDDTAVAGAIVRVEVPRTLPFGAPGTGAAGNAVSGTDGAFAVDGLQAGAYMVNVEHPDFSPSRVRVELDAQQEPAELVAHLSRGGALAGMVRNPNREPIPDARILVTQGMGEDARTITTGADGRYQVERLAPGNYQVMRQPEQGRGFAAGFGMKSAVVREGETTNIDFDEASKIVLSGRVLRGETPMPEAMLVFRFGEAGTPADIKTTQSDAAGVYRIGLDQSGSYQVSVQTGGATGAHGQTRVQLLVPEQPDVQQDVILPESTILGRVSDAEGKALVSAVVTAVRDGAAANDPTRQLVGQADAAGAYRLEGTQPGVYRVTARAPGFRMSEKHPVQVDDSTPQATVDFELEAGRLVRGRLVDPQQHGIANAMIFIAPSGSAASAGSGLFSPSQTDVNGGFELTVPADGALDITGVSSAWAPARIQGVTPPADETEPLPALQATSGGRIRIHVSGPHGPLSGVQVLLRAVPSFPGSEFALAGPRRPQASGADGVVLASMLAPNVGYEVSVPGRRDVKPAQVSVEEGAEAEISILLP